ncbi:hypothetical protein [Enterococcus dispar]|uniref:hypothetical protein n=1 Tax=Enterococcus dispar TaxID=44009 RepID=UPI0021D40393|nr:hypothetical protein [Enterococcus dispar]MCU7356830.1 hypothetical protein [Enterococcus dispar]MDT2704931.1 hypothetical protein [Enterococcus dispar]
MNQDELVLQLSDLIMKKIHPLIDKEVEAVALDLQDQQKEITNARSISLSIEIKVDESRQMLTINGHGKSKLPSRNLKKTVHHIQIANTGQISLFDQIDLGDEER